MKRLAPLGLFAAALAASACMKGAPVGPRDSNVSLQVHFQNGTPGEAIQVSIASFRADSEGALDSIFTGTFAVTAATQNLTVQFDLAPCLGKFPPDDLGPYCLIQVGLTLVNNGVIQAQQELGELLVRPGQVVAAQPVVLAAGNNPPAIATLDTARVVEPALIRYHLTGSDPDGDITTLQATDIVNGQLDISTPYSFFPPLASIDGIFYALQTDFVGANQIEVSLSDSKFNASALDTIPALPPIGVVFLDSMTVDTTTDSVVVNVSPPVDSLELVFLDNASGFESLAFVCGGAAPPDFTTSRFACKRPPGDNSAFVIAVPVDFSGNPGGGLRCSVPATSCVPLPAADRVTASRRPRFARARR